MKLNLIIFFLTFTFSKVALTFDVSCDDCFELLQEKTLPLHVQKSPEGVGDDYLSEEELDEELSDEEMQMEEAEDDYTREEARPMHDEREKNIEKKWWQIWK